MVLEIQRGNAYHQSHDNIMLIESVGSEPSERARQLLRENKEGATFRLTRSYLTIYTRASEDALKALSDGGRRTVDASMYFQSLVLAHFPFLNKIVNAYRKAAVDPFAMEVTEWDIPVWFVATDSVMKRISLVTYLSHNAYPHIGTFPGTDSTPVHLTSIEEVQNSLDGGELAGDAELLDAWALYYRGRFGDAIRSLVTAIEVVLEDRFRHELANQGYAVEEIDQRLESTFNDFEGRLADYQQVTKSRLPGPFVSYLPYINGVRLKAELDATRRLRHKIVHEGLRLDRSMKGHLQRAMETMSWLFNWFRHDSQLPVTGTGKRYGLKSAMLGDVAFFPIDYSAEGVTVRELRLNGEAQLADSLLREQFADAIDSEHPDIEKFAFMCFSKLGFERRDAAIPEPDSPFLVERCYVRDSDAVTVVFLLEIFGLPDPELLQKVATRILAMKSLGYEFSRVLCLVNHQSGLPWPLRSVDDAIPEQVAEIASQCGITLVTTTDLLFLILGIESYQWDPAAIRVLLSRPGRQGALPPGSIRVGSVVHFYDRIHVMSIVLVGDVHIRRGDTLVLRLADRYFVQLIDSMHVNQVPVDAAHGGSRVGIETSLHRQDIPSSCPVFVIPKSLG